MEKNIHFQKKFLLFIPLIIIVFVIWFLITHSGIGIDVDNPPKFIQTSFIDIDKIYSISKFRSAAGHDFSDGEETCRSMKHYFVPQHYATDTTSNGSLPPAPKGEKDDLAIFSPVDGYFSEMESEQYPVGKQIHIVPDSNPQFTIRLFHVYPLSNITANTFGIGSHVKAGQQIGWISRMSDTDISVEVNQYSKGKSFISYFSVLPDKLFEAYKKRGATSTDDFIISKEYRNSNPLQCKNDKTEAFIYPQGYDQTKDFFYLTGYLPIVRDTSGQHYLNNNQN